VNGLRFPSWVLGGMPRVRDEAHSSMDCQDGVIIMFAALASVLTPVLAEGAYLYWGGGLGTVVVIVLIVLLLRC